METEMYKDVGEEIIFKLKMIIAKLDKIIENEKELPDTSPCRESSPRDARETSNRE